MTVFAINFPARTVRVFNTLTEAMNGARLGELVITNAAGIARQRIYDVEELHAFYCDAVGIQVAPFADVRDASESIFAVLPEMVSLGVGFAAEPQHDLNGEMKQGVRPIHPAPVDVMVAVSPEAIDEVMDAAVIDGLLPDVPAEDTGEWLAPADDRAANLQRELTDRVHAIVGHVQAIIAKAASYRALADAGVSGSDQRAAVAEREITNLIARLTQNSVADLERAGFARQGVDYLEHVAPGLLAPPGAPMPKREAKPYVPRKNGETRGRRSALEGKRLTPSPKLAHIGHTGGPRLNPYGKGTRRHATLQLVLDEPGITYEAFVEKGGNPADLRIAMNEGFVRQDG